MTILIKTCGLFSSTKKLRELLDKFASDQIAVLWDVHHPYRDFGETPAETITNLGETGGFSSDLAHTVLTDEGVQARLFDNIVSLIRAKDYYGLNINFEYIYPFDRDSYSQFVKRAAELLHPLGCPVSTAIAPKESAGQEGLLYTAHDYAAHGKYADKVILMTYEWGLIAHTFSTQN